MNSPEAICSECGRGIVPSAMFCAFCGRRVPGEIAPDSRKEAEIPDPATLEGPCAVFHTGAELLPIQEVGKVVSKLLGRPLPDVTRAIRASGGIVARAVDAEMARGIANELSELGLSVFIISELQLMPLPPLLRMRRFRFTPDGFQCEGYTWDSSLNVDVAWQDVTLVSCARVAIDVVEYEPADEPIRTMIGTETVEFPHMTTGVRHELVLDIILKKPWRRLRLDENPAAVSLAQPVPASDSRVTLHRAATHIERLSRGVPLNKGVRLLAKDASPELWADVTFSSKHDLDSYNLWLVQLVRFGIPLTD